MPADVAAIGLYGAPGPSQTPDRHDTCTKKMGGNECRPSMRAWFASPPGEAADKWPIVTLLKAA